MERKIGEIFEYNGEWYQCVEGKTICSECDLRNIICQRDTSINNPFKECSGNYRTDKKNIIFKKLEKVGEPYMLEDKKFQKYRVFKTPYIYHKIDYSWQSFADPYYISLEIKQNKEDMEDLDKIKVRDYTKVEEINVMEEKKLNLKPFDIQKAREGKPVCTRDGRKARIICFDRRLFYKNVSYPILALVECSDGEDDVCGYNEKGKVLIEDGAEYKDDLMMLPEKKEGWVNVYKERCYESKEEAISCRACNMECIDTIRLEWEE